MTSIISWLQASPIAAVMGQSQLLTGLVSGLHLLGLTLIVGGAFVSSLRFLGWMFPDRPAADVASAAVGGITIGIILSVATGIVLLAPRVAAAAENGVFRLKMLLLVTAAAFHFVFYRRLARRAGQSRGLLRVAGALAVLLWFGVAAAGCAFILLE
jgi:hypothetical protein